MRCRIGFVFAAPLTACASAPTTRALAEFSTADGDVRLTISPDGRHALWGVATGGNPAQLDIIASERTSNGWSAPRPVPFNTAYTEFDPSFAPDGRSVLFFSDRPGGSGGDDLYVVSFSPERGTYGAPANLGQGVNTAGDEWAPLFSGDSDTLLFASDGHGGEGRHDLFFATLVNGAWGAPVNLGPGVNTPAEDFDATFLAGDRAIIFAQGNFDDDAGVRLMLARRHGEVWRTVRDLGPEINCAPFVNGPSIASAEPGILFFSASCEGGRGRSDLWRIVAPEAANIWISADRSAYRLPDRVLRAENSRSGRRR